MITNGKARIAPAGAASRLVKKYRAVLRKIEADPALRGAERAGRFQGIWDEVERAGMAVDPSLQPIRYEAVAWELEAQIPIPKSHRGTRFSGIEHIPNRGDFHTHLVRRLAATPSPVHRAHYADVLWEVFGGYQYALAAASGYLETVPLRSEPADRRQRTDAILRTLQIGIQLKNHEFISVAKAALVNEIVQGGREVDPEEALAFIPWLLEIPRAERTPAELELGRRYAERVAARCRQEPGRFHVALYAYQLAADLAGRLADRQGEKADLLAVGETLEEAAQHESRSGLVEAPILEAALAQYIKIGATERLGRLKLRLRELYELAEGEFGPVSDPIPVDFSSVDAYAESLIQLPPFESLASFLAWRDHVPSKSRMETVVEAMEPRYRKIQPFPFPLVLLRQGRAVSAAATLEEQRFALLCDYYRMRVHLSAAMFARVYRPLMESGRWTADTLTDFLATGVAFDADKLPFLRAGIERYCSRDYISAIHVLVPQIEDILRRLCARIGLPTASTRKGVSMEISLDEVLDTPELREGLGDDLWFYLRFLLIEQRGENLRNDIAHGLFSEGQAREPLATLVVDILLVLRTLAISPATETAAIGASPPLLHIVRDIEPALGQDSPVESFGRELPRQAWIRVMTDRIAREFHPLQVILFGSYARGDAKPDSDVDLLVVFASVADKRAQVVEIYKALTDLPLAKDVLVTTPDEIGERGDVPSTVLYAALREGRVLFDRG